MIRKEALNRAVPPKTEWCALAVDEVAAQLGVGIANGLSGSEVFDRMQRVGRNELVERAGRPAWRLLLDQFASTLVVMLLVSSVIAGAVGKLRDAVAIVAIVALNAALGFVQEYRAERAMAALRKLAAPIVRVRRDGRVQEVSAQKLVPGDIVQLEAGNLVPADGRLIESASLRIQEAVLTGESEAVEKQTQPLPEASAVSLGDQTNMAFLGTTVTFGRGQMLITATGMHTQLGQIAEMIQGVASVKTPLQRRLDRLGRTLAVFAAVLVTLVFGLGLLIGEDWQLMLMTAVSMAVAVVPEGLPAVVTIALALGAQRMLRRNALIRKLPAVETLGSVTVICSDKTGTLTENRMTVIAVDLAGHRFEVEEQLRHRNPTISGTGASIGIVQEEHGLALLLAGAALCNDAVLQPDRAHAGEFRAVGDPTEAALVVAAARFGLRKEVLEKDCPRIAEAPFDSDRKRMTTTHRVDHSAAWIAAIPELKPGIKVVFSKGGVDNLLEVCTGVWAESRREDLNENWRRRAAAANEELAQKGMRVLGVAFRLMAESEILTGEPVRQLERDLVFIGLVGMLDPPRPEVMHAVTTCKNAGIRPVMITGDHPITARRIAEDLGISIGGKVLTGQDIAGMSRKDLEQVVEEVSVFARVAPEHKLQIVQALQERGHIVAMTGDGVNDAPALRRADIGVAMGITGTDVSKEAAAMVLLDDNFTTIVAAVEEGRTIYDNVRRFLMFSLAGNLGKTILVLCCPLLGMPIPLSPFQILWLNLVTDGALGLGIGVEPAERRTMRRPPQSPAAGVFSGGLGWQTLWLGALLGIVNLAVAVRVWKSGDAAWQTIVLATVVLLQIIQAYVSRSMRESVFSQSLLTNKPLMGAAALVFVLLSLSVYADPLRDLFGTTALAASQLAIPFAASLLILAVVEGIKRIRRRKDL